METVVGTYTRHYSDGKIEVENFEIDAETGTRVLFVDNSYLNYLPENTGDSLPAGTLVNNHPLTGTVCRTNCGYDARHPYSNATITYPIVVLADNGEVYYCNPLNIQVINDKN